MAKRVVIVRKETELTKEEAKQYILYNVFTCVGSRFQLKDFPSRAVASGLEGNLEELVNELIKEGKLRIEYEYLHAGPGGGYFLVIRRIA